MFKKPVMKQVIVQEGSEQLIKWTLNAPVTRGDLSFSINDSLQK
jgi:hypothetical protein